MKARAGRLHHHQAGRSASIARCTRRSPTSIYGDARSRRVPRHAHDRGLLTERGLKHVIACVEAMKEVLGDEIGLALDCGPGWTVPDAIRLARALEPLQRHVAGGPAHRRLLALS